MNIFLIEDNENLRSLWQYLFRRTSFTLKVFEDGQSALRQDRPLEESLKEDLPDLVITDYFLPDRSGIDVINEFRRRKAGVPCILVTGNDSEDLMVRLENHDNVRYMKKPVKFTTLLGVISEMLPV